MHAGIIFTPYSELEGSNSSNKSHKRNNKLFVITKLSTIDNLSVENKINPGMIESNSVDTANTRIALDKSLINPVHIAPFPFASNRPQDIRLPLPASTYYKSTELTIRPKVRVNPDLDPPNVKTIVATGVIILKLWINASGNVDQVTVEQSNLPEKIAVAAANGFKEISFHPGEINDQPVASVISIEIRYDDDRLVEP